MRPRQFSLMTLLLVVTYYCFVFAVIGIFLRYMPPRDTAMFANTTGFFLAMPVLVALGPVISIRLIFLCVLALGLGELVTEIAGPKQFFHVRGIYEESVGTAAFACAAAAGISIGLLWLRTDRETFTAELEETCLRIIPFWRPPGK